MSVSFALCWFLTSVCLFGVACGEFVWGFDSGFLGFYFKCAGVVVCFSLQVLDGWWVGWFVIGCVCLGLEDLGGLCLLIWLYFIVFVG